MSERSTAKVFVPPLLDYLVITAFVVVGRRSHDEGSALAGFFRVWWPFAAGLGLSAVCTGTWWRPLVWSRAVGAWLGTVAVGMTLRVGIQGRDFKPSFVVVTTVFLGLGMLGWRAVARRVSRRRVKA